MKAWIGFDLDGTLAKYDKWEGPCVIGEPILPMIEELKRISATGMGVKIFTARVYGDESGEIVKAVQKWCFENIGKTYEVTCVKDYGMISLYDDRCISVKRNSGTWVDANAEK